MRIRLVLVWMLCILTLGRATLLSCTCRWTGSFLSVAPKEDLVIRGKVLNYAGHGMDVEVYEMLRGGPKTEQVRIWGDTGASCSPSVSSFPVGTEWILAVRINAAEGGYWLSACGEYAVKVENETVSGRLTGAGIQPGPVETMPLNELRSRLQGKAR